MGHVDHGKSAILDYIRKTNVVEKEAGGITQHVSAYEVEHEYEGVIRKITFLDTPGHEAFKAIRKRGASVADIAILVVAADDGVKVQTLDALEAIKEANIPFVVAINKIDKPEANLQKTQSQLIENEIYIEGMGGDIPYVAVSAKTGEGIDDLLDTLILVADLQELKADTEAPAEGVIIETVKETKRGVGATLILKNGTLNAGDFVVSDNSWAPVRIYENFKGDAIKTATFSAPVKVVGFVGEPPVGEKFVTVNNKKEAENKAKTFAGNLQKTLSQDVKDDKFAIPVVIKADTLGSKEAILYELSKLEDEKAYFKVVKAGVGEVSKDDAQKALSAGALILGFNSQEDKSAREIIRQNGIDYRNFDIIYNLTDFAKDYIKNKAPKITQEQTTGKAVVLKIFSSSKKGAVLGGKVKEGSLRIGAHVKIYRRDVELGEGDISTLQSNKQDTQKVEEGSMYGAFVATPVPLAEGDVLEAIEEIEI